MREQSGCRYRLQRWHVTHYLTIVTPNKTAKVTRNQEKTAKATNTCRKRLTYNCGCIDHMLQVWNLVPTSPNQLIITGSDLGLLPEGESRRRTVAAVPGVGLSHPAPARAVSSLRCNEPSCPFLLRILVRRSAQSESKYSHCHWEGTTVA